MDSEARVPSLMGGALKGPNGLTRVPHDEGLAPPSVAVPVPLGSRERGQAPERRAPVPTGCLGGTHREGKGLTRFIGTRDNAARQWNRSDDVAEPHA